MLKGLDKDGFRCPYCNGRNTNTLDEKRNECYDCGKMFFPVRRKGKKIRFEKCTYADVSLSHLPPADRQLLEEHAITDGGDPKGCGPIAYSYPDGEATGFFVFIPDVCDIVDRVEECELAGFGSEFCTIMEQASRQGYRFVRFDTDGAVVPGLKRFGR